MATLKHWLLMTITLVAMGYGQEICPPQCECDLLTVYKNETLILTNCSGMELTRIPLGIPTNTQYLDLRDNVFTEVGFDSVINLINLMVLDTRSNKNLRDIATAPNLLNLTSLYTDKGSTCCIYELAWTKEKAWVKASMFLISPIGWDSEAYDVAKESCIATEPYTVCKDDLINSISLTIYTVTVVLSLLLNPWVILVNLTLPQRRTDPHVMILVHFSVTNIFLTLYATIFVAYGFLYLNQYQYYMDEWMENPACTITGFMLVASSLHFIFLCMIVVIHFYRQIHNPLVRRRHFTAKRLHIAVLIIALIAIAIALLPFVTGENYYNNVALCLPFYTSETNNNQFSLMFLALYTTVMTISLVVIVTLSSIIVHSLLQQNKRIIHNDDQTNSTEQQILRENRKVRKAILFKVGGYVIVTSILVVLLFMSCVKNSDIAQFGREWFARLCVVQAVVWPIIGSFKNKTFFQDTRRMFQIWNCYDWERNKIVLRGLSKRQCPARRPKQQPSSDNLERVVTYSN